MRKLLQQMRLRNISISSELNSEIQNRKLQQIACKYLHQPTQHQVRKAKDPIYSHLYVICQQGNSDKKERKIKTCRSSEQNSEQRISKKDRNLSELKSHKKSLLPNFSLHLPRISEQFQQVSELHRQSRQKYKKRNSTLEVKFNSNKYNDGSLLGNRGSRLNTENKKMPVFLRPQQRQKNPDSQLDKNKNEKRNILERVGKQKRKIRVFKQWREVEILKTPTYFVRMKNKKQKQNELRTNFSNTKAQKDFINIPEKKELPDFIKTYQPLNPEINVDSLVKSSKFGILFEENLSLYFGKIEEGKRSGLGIYICGNSKFEGSWQMDEKIQGYQITSNGYYRGKFRKNKRHGQGQYIWQNGQSYSGEWKNGFKQGLGVWKSGKGDSYIGQWSQGKVKGFGVHKTSCGQCYEGNFEDFLKTGKGKQSFPNGDFYEGEYKFGQPNGKGKYIWKNGVEFKGIFMNGYRKGEGTLIAKGCFRYQGNFDLDLPHGYGKLKYQNGDEYIGQFNYGDKHGKGTLNLKSERKIKTGLWKNNIFEFNEESK